MKKVATKKKIPWGQIFSFILMGLVGVLCGILLTSDGDGFSDQTSLTQTLLAFGLRFLCLLVAFYLQIIIHEAGHLLFGLQTGYRFVSFRVGSFLWTKVDGKLRLKRYALAGTGGQCLMAPPDLQDGKIPLVLYNLGGCLLNLAASLLFLLAYCLCPNVPFVSSLLLMLCLVGVAFALVNGIPLQLGRVDNDGRNALSLGKNPAAVYGFWMQLKCVEEMDKGVRLKDMPAEWFTFPAETDLPNSMVAAQAVFACNRLMDACRFAEADALMAHLLAVNSGISGLHRGLLVCDRITVELLGDCRPEVIDGMLTKEVKKLMKAMKTFPSVCRTEYALALLHRKDLPKAAKWAKAFEKLAPSYPYPQEIEAERALMELAQVKTNQFTAQEG